MTKKRSMEAFKSEEGRWYFSDADGNVIAGPFDNEGKALAWIEANRPASRPRMQP